MSHQDRKAYGEIRRMQLMEEIAITEAKERQLMRL